MDNISHLVLKAKERGDKFYREGFYKAAASEYSICIQHSTAGGHTNGVLRHDPDLIRYRSNRCACYLQLNQLSDALEDALECVKLDNTWIKGYVRLGTCYQRLQRWNEAVLTYRQALEVQPSNDELKRLLRDSESRIFNQSRNNTSYQQSAPGNSDGSSYGSSQRPSQGFNPSMSSNPWTSWQPIVSNAWNQLKQISQNIMIHGIRFYHSLSSELKVIYGVGLAMALYYIYSSLSYSSYRYYDDYGYGGLSTTSLMLIMAAAYFVPPQLESVIGYQYARPFFGMNWTTFLWLVNMFSNRSSGMFGNSRYYGQRRRYY